MEQTVQQAPHVGRPRPPAGLRRRQERLDQAVLVIAQGLTGAKVSKPGRDLRASTSQPPQWKSPYPNSCQPCLSPLLKGGWLHFQNGHSARTGTAGAGQCRTGLFQWPKRNGDSAMPAALIEPVEMIRRLIAFDTTSRNSNLDLIRWVADYLDGFGIRPVLVHDETGAKANLFATLGPDADGGIVLSGHTDVVPVDGQDWSSDPWTLTERDGRLYGRGSADMKSFCALVLAKVPALIAAARERPFHIALSYDEEVGCLGIHGLLRHLRATGRRPSVV